MISFLQQMGIFVVPLLVLSVYGFGLILAKNKQFQSARPLKASQFNEFQGLLAKGDDNAVTKVPSGHPLALVASHSSQNKALRQVYAQGLLSTLEERLVYFPALANLATLTGLFGTVCGMIVAFLALRSGGGADPSALAGGIAQALVATALGLVTAIPSLAAHALFQRQLTTLTGQLETTLVVLGSREGPVA
jgi:biopolymer transport protein ExbB